MAGTVTGGLKASATNKKKDPDFYRRIGAIGGKKGTTGGFASTKKSANGLTGLDRARIYGRIGGKKSKRGPARITNETTK